MKFALVTLCLNEMEWLPKLYAQHKDWPSLTDWVFVEAADAVYAETNPDLVNSIGLSIDGTSDWLSKLASEDPRVHYIPFGFSRHQDRALCKIPARQAYLDYLESVRPDYFLVLDADEFYCRKDQDVINRRMENSHPRFRHFCFGWTHIWHPASLSDSPLFSYHVMGGFWAMPHTKGVRWAPNLRYVDTHQKCVNGNGMELMMRISHPKCVHMAFASDSSHRAAKHRYYEDRGEASPGQRRGWYVESRKAFETYQPGDELPRGARVLRYTGPVPEVFQ